MREMNNEMELNMNELEQVNGGEVDDGGSFCIFYGMQFDGNIAGASACFTRGASTGPVGGDTGFGATACFLAVFGVGIGGVSY